MSINVNFPKQISFLKRAFLDVPFPSFSALRGAHLPSPSPIFSFIPTAAAPGCSLWTSRTHLETQRQGERAKRHFYPNQESIPNIPALNQYLHGFWCPEHGWTLQLWTGRWLSWVIKLANKCAGLHTFHVVSRSQGADFLKASLYCNCHSLIRSLLSWKVKHFPVVSCIHWVVIDSEH